MNEASQPHRILFHLHTRIRWMMERWNRYCLCCRLQSPSRDHPAVYYDAFICPTFFFFSLHIISAPMSRNNVLSMILSAGSCSLFWPQFCLAAGYWINGNAVGAVRLWELWKPVTAAGLMENTTSSQRSRPRWIQTARPRLLWSAGDSTKRGKDNGKCPCAEEQKGIKVKWRCSERDGQDYWLIGLFFFILNYCAHRNREEIVWQKWFQVLIITAYFTVQHSE